MKKIRRVVILLMLFFAFDLTACGGRVPSGRTAQSLTRHYFSHYGSRFKKTVFGASKINRVEINRIEDLSLHLAAIDAFVTLQDGTVARVLLTVKRNPPFGWRVVSWEMLDLR